MIRHLYISLTILIALCAPTTMSAQQIFTAEFAPYEMRDEAEERYRKLKEYYMDLLPKVVSSDDVSITMRRSFELPPKWSDRVVTLHLESAGAAYDLIINNRDVLSCEDAITPTNVDITKYLTQGENNIDMVLRYSRYGVLEESLDIPATVSFLGSYISAQPSTYVHNLDVKLTPVPNSKNGRLSVEVALRNDFSSEETLDVGYDIYDPSGKLIEFSVNTFSVGAKSTDTVRFSPIIPDANSYRWTTNTPNLYKVMVYTRRGGIVTGYIPRNVGLLDVEYRDNKLYNFGEQISPNIYIYNANIKDSKILGRRELRAIKSNGYNTIAPTYPQPQWVYELCDELGIWIIDQVNINTTYRGSNRGVGGTPANDPQLLGEYLNRAKSCYSRSREFGSVIAYSMGGEDSGNGYNMYKVYEWMKSVEKSRPIIYIGADGEWNSDVIE